MKLTEIKLLEASQTGHKWPSTKDEVKKIVEDWLRGFRNPAGCTEEKLKMCYEINSDLSVNITNHVSVASFYGFAKQGNTTKRVYHDNGIGLPFKIKKSDSAVRIDGFKGLTSLEGCAQDIDSAFTVQDCSSLVNMKFGPQRVWGPFEILDCKNLESLEGCPKKVATLVIGGLPNLKTFEGFPKIIEGDLTIQKGTGLTSLCGIGANIKRIDGHFRCDQKITSGGLGLLLIDGLTYISYNGTNSAARKAMKIIGSYLDRTDEIFECQEELINAGLEEYAQL